MSVSKEYHELMTCSKAHDSKFLRDTIEKSWEEYIKCPDDLDNLMSRTNIYVGCRMQEFLKHTVTLRGFKHVICNDDGNKFVNSLMSTNA